MVCLDTDVIIDFLREEKGVFEKIKKLKDDETELSTTTINSFELFKGNKKLSDKSDKNSVEIFLNNIRINEFTIGASKKAAEIFEELKSKGEMIELTDIMIASVALSNDESILTRNVKHFEKIKELRLEKF